ncbi:MAG: hypothetical protein CMI53_05120, partial [Parcubacteria group bacterium]|nr:hypothetical protein [Parcubacteria group bacterium]
MIKKLLTYSVAVATVVWSVGLLATPLAVGAAVSGDLIKLQCSAGSGVNDPCRAVYYLGADGKRYVFPNEKTYSTWYSDFSGVTTVADTVMSSYSIGGNVTYRPGTKLVKITTDPKVYAVAGNGTLMWMTTGDLAESIYGADWASMVEDVPDAFFVNYTVGSDIDDAADYDETTQMDGSPNINDDKNLTDGGDGPVASTGTSLTIALASDTPASGLLLANTINNKFTKVMLTASADGDIVVDQLTVRRGGTVASDSPFSNIALIDAATSKRVGNTKTLNSDHMAVFNKDMTIAAGTTKTLYLAGNMGATSSYAGEIPSLDLYSVTLTGSAAVVGTLPIVGNFQTVNGTITVGGLTVANGNNNPDAATQKIGTTNYIVSGFKLTASSAEDFEVTQIAFDQGGTASDDDVGNLDLLIDDAIVATITTTESGVAFFDLSASPVTIEKGKTVDVDLQVDLLDGSDRTVRFDIKDESDVVAMGQLFGAEVKVACGSGCTADADPFWTAPVTTIDKGALRVGPATLSAVNIPEDADQLVLGKFEFEAKGEPIEITALPIGIIVATSSGNLDTDSTVDITNISVYDSSGKIVSGPIDPTLKNYQDGGTSNNVLLQATSTDTITVPAGVNIYTIKADIDSDFGSDDTIIVHIRPNQISAKGETTGLAVTATPASEQQSATMTVKSAALSLSTSPTPVAASVVAGTDQHLFAKINLGAESSGEDIKVTKVLVRVECNSACNPAEVSNWSIYDGSTELATTNDPDSQTSGKTTDDDDATSTFTFTTPLVITKGTSKTLEVKGTISTAATDGVVTVGMSDATAATSHVTAKGNDTNLAATVTLSASDGQAQTLVSAGELTINIDSSTPKAGLIPANSTGLTAAVYNTFALYEDINIEKMYITATQVNSGGLDQISMFHIYDGGTLLASVEPTSTDAAARTVLVDITNTPIVVPRDTSKKLTIKVDTSDVDYELGSLGAAGEGFSFIITAAGDVTAKGAQSGKTISTKNVDSTASKGMTLFKSVPVVATNDLLTSGKIASGALASGTDNDKSLYAFSVTADSAGDVALHHVMFRIATTTATVTNFKLTDGSENVAFGPTGDVGLLWMNESSAQAQAGEGSIVMVFTDDQIAPSGVTADPDDNIVPYTIPAGETRTFTLIGDVACLSAGASSCSGTGSGSVNIQMLGDVATPGTNPTDAFTAVDTFEELLINSFYWSDLNRTSILGTSSTTASSAAQWTNGMTVALTNGGKMVATST